MKISKFEALFVQAYFYVLDSKGCLHYLIWFFLSNTQKHLTVNSLLMFFKILISLKN